MVSYVTGVSGLTSTQPVCIPSGVTDSKALSNDSNETLEVGTVGEILSDKIRFASVIGAMKAAPVQVKRVVGATVAALGEEPIDKFVANACESIPGRKKQEKNISFGSLTTGVR